MQPRRLFFISIAIVFGLAVAYGAILAILIVWKPTHLETLFRPRPHKPFVKKHWDSTVFGNPDRYKMANDLLWSGRLLNKTELEVRALLGDPSSEDRLGKKILIGYDLVRQKSFPAKCSLLPDFMFINIDTWLLEIQCEDGIVKAVRIRST